MVISIIVDREYIEKAKEKLGNKMAFIIADELGIEDFDEHNLKCRCPFHDEKTPSFIWNPKTLNFHCFGCGGSYDIIDVFMYKGMTYMQALQRLFNLANIKYALGEVGVKTKGQYRYPKPIYDDNKNKVYAYWEKRGISKQTIDYLDIQQDKDGNSLFQYYDTNDVLTMCKVRPSKKIPHGEPKTWCLKNADTAPILFNMNKINVDSPLLITTGEGDCAAAIESGFTNAVSIPLGDGNMHWIDENWDWLEQFDDIIIAYDNDESGEKYVKNVVPRLGSWRCKIVNLPSVVDIDDKKIHIKDLNEYLVRCGKADVFEAITHAQDSPVPSVEDFADIKEMDMSEIDGITLGLKEVDKALMRFFFGSFNIISGTPGAGKTSILLQFVAQSLDQGYDCWLYSKELPTWMTKNWLVHLLAGDRNLDKYSSETGGTYYKVKPIARQMIDEHYANRLKIYRDDYPNDVKSIEESMETSVRRYGSKLLILDNLMTIDLGANDNNKNEKETEFVNWLIQFSMKYKVCVILVCHPNKTQDYREDIGMYNIAGSSNIINLAHRAIGLRRITKNEKQSLHTDKPSEYAKYSVKMNVIKDRLTGKTNFETGIHYAPSSRRFFSTYEEYAHQYKWDGTQYKDNLPIPECLIDETSEVFGQIRKE